MGADFSLYVKSIATYGPAFFGYDNSVLARVRGKHYRHPIAVIGVVNTFGQRGLHSTDNNLNILAGISTGKLQKITH